MRRSLADGYELDDDPARVDVDVVHRFLSDAAYWVPGRSRATVERLIATSTRVIAAYDRTGALVGFARVMSDGANMAWLGDVFVLRDHRGRGIGASLVREAVDDPRHRDCAWYLNTRDAHDLYSRFGFRPADPARTMVRPRPEPTSSEGA